MNASHSPHYSTLTDAVDGLGTIPSIADPAIFKNATVDQHRRPLNDLRISVIDRCNFRCPYCMPGEEGGHQYHFLKKEEWLTFEEIRKLTQVFVNLGVSKVRITGGEPLLRENLPSLIEKIRSIKGVSDLALTTNGIFLKNHAKSLRDAGLSRITISLDTLDENTFRVMSGGKGELTQVLEGITAAQQCGFGNLKINAVIQRNLNDKNILQLAEYFRGTKHIIRFIEYMDVGNQNGWRCDLVVPSAQVLKIIDERFPLEAMEPNYQGEVAARYRYKDGQGEIGFISSITQPFCGTCTRARLSTDGKFYTCLFAGSGLDLRSQLRRGATEQELLQAISNTWKNRSDRYSEERFTLSQKNFHSKKVEMYQIGG
ncbi:MAG: GTP 3',8-cyclase MoaA [Candidatus Omnitrophota bacterium]